MSLAAVIVAAGASTRAGCDKMFARIAGKPVVLFSLEAFECAPAVSEIVVVARDDVTMRNLLAAAKLTKLRAVIRGGDRRQDSVQKGLCAISTAADFVAVHDAARPLITPREIERVFLAAQKHQAAVLAAPVTDTLKIGDEKLRVAGSIERENVFAMQTPQIFARQLLREACARVEREALAITDEVSAVQNFGAEVAIVPTEEQNFKITYAADLALAELILQQRANKA